MGRRKRRRAGQKSKAPQYKRAQHGQKAAGATSPLDAVVDQKIAENRKFIEQAENSRAWPGQAGVQADADALLQSLCRDYNVRRLRDRIAVKVVGKRWRQDTLDWTGEKPSPSQLGRLRNAVLRPVRKDQGWKTQFEEFLKTLDSGSKNEKDQKWSRDSISRLNELAAPDSFWEASGITPPKEIEQEAERLFYWRTALTTLLLGALRAHSRSREEGAS